MIRRALIVLSLSTLFLGCREEQKPPEVSKRIVGRVTSCRDDYNLIDFLTAQGELIHLHVASGMPMCGTFTKGGLWVVNYRKSQEEGSNSVYIDYIAKVWEGKK